MAAAWNDPQYGALPLAVSVEYAQDINLLRFHDNSNGLNYVDSAGTAALCSSGVGADTKPLPTSGKQADAIPGCLTYKALHQEPVVCQRCHYTPALDLAQVGPLGGSATYPDNGTAPCPPDANPSNAENCNANGRTQRVQPSMSRVIHRLAHSPSGRFYQFNMPPPDTDVSNYMGLTHRELREQAVTGTSNCIYLPEQDTLGAPTGTTTRPPNYQNYVCGQCAADGKSVAGCAVEATCYQCHPGTYTKCLRGAMASAGMYCQDCHGTMAQVGNDFSENFSAATPFPAGAVDKRVPWANEPGCQSCHVGDAVNQPADKAGFIYDDEGIRLPAGLARG